MQDETENISRKTRNRTLETVFKAGHMDGATDGQNSVYQQCFDVGYKQGLNFGFDLGFQKAMRSNHQRNNSIESTLRDAEKINCQICVNVLALHQNVANLYNVQQEKNNELLNQINAK